MSANGKTVKCVVWDLDHTVWDGALLEDDRVALRPGVTEAIRTLDERGILHSIASRNDHAAAMARLEELGLADYFLYPQINWGKKSSSVRAVAKALNIGLDAVAFIDDQPFERDEVAFELPQVRCLDAAALPDLARMPELTPRFVTEDSRIRRQMYRADQVRQGVEERFDGAQDQFLSTLGMRFEIRPAAESDLRRAEELTVRTNQLNTTGVTYSYEELDAFRESDRHLLLTASLTDRYGPYGTIGLALVETGEQDWNLRLLLMSCRVMSRGVGVVLINHIKRRARDAGAQLIADFVSTDRNRMMYVSFKFNGFAEISRDERVVRFAADLSSIPADPPYLDVRVVG
ncbi:HAD-IIIC family phosphatase [Dactylosporangium fulvum]|uniref:HAD-IIIC family phosphatase n=1 Tax=Dactylosporangium fulvum TaxID=53359 RepID=A0ABY5W5S9_9ACTN|nr:HAD-IIIC family phosphatase [Dactylosporangium fulvum]UWP85403.1 HAD-IIIC family phosphatase [Dactylosporangium fulvum]